jgi:hypothetical protein
MYRDPNPATQTEPVNKCPLEWLVASVVGNVDSSAEMFHVVVDDEMDAKVTNEHTATWTIIPKKCAERENRLKMTQTMATRIPPQTTTTHATIGFSQDTLRLTATTSNMSGLNALNSIR